MKKQKKMLHKRNNTKIYIDKLTLGILAKMVIRTGFEPVSACVKGM